MSYAKSGMWITLWCRAYSQISYAKTGMWIIDSCGLCMDVFGNNHLFDKLFVQKCSTGNKGVYKQGYISCLEHNFVVEEKHLVFKGQ